MKNNLLSIDEYRNNPEFYFSKGLRCANKKNLKDAYKNLAKAANLEPDNSEYKFNIACFLSEMHRPREANRLFNDILTNFDPTLYDCYFGLGCNWLELGNVEKAAENFEKYLYFDEEGEFNEEVREMNLYLQLYNNISNNKKFLRLSKASFRKAVKSLDENNVSNAIKDLYRAISLNPFNIEARNLLTMVLLAQGQYDRALYINETVISTFPGEIWANCLKIYILSHTKKHKKLNDALTEIVYADINSRDELLCVATTLLIFDRVTDFTKLLEMYKAAYSDWLICSALLLGQNPLDEYQKLFEQDTENRADYMTNPAKYKLLAKKKEAKSYKVTNKYMPVIKCALEHREIMYTPQYEKEIIRIFNNIVELGNEPINKIDGRIEAYSAALEYIYCLENCIEMEKEELKQKYNIPSAVFNTALKKFNCR